MDLFAAKRGSFAPLNTPSNGNDHDAAKQVNTLRSTLESGLDSRCAMTPNIGLYRTVNLWLDPVHVKFDSPRY